MAGQNGNNGFYLKKRVSSISRRRTFFCQICQIARWLFLYVYVATILVSRASIQPTSIPMDSLKLSWAMRSRNIIFLGRRSSWWRRYPVSAFSRTKSQFILLITMVGSWSGRQNSWGDLAYSRVWSWSRWIWICQSIWFESQGISCYRKSFTFLISYNS